jgi:uncharacterized cupin superfamily protein
MIVNAAQSEKSSDMHGVHFAVSMTELAVPAGGKAIGANLTRVPPGKAAFPLHHHFANEEHFFILSGTGVLRTPSGTQPVRPEDYIVCLPGGPEQAHQLINTGVVDLVYLAISTTVVPEIVGYPDSGKTGVRSAYTGDPADRFLVRNDRKNEVEYWDDETGAAVGDLVGKSGG